MSGGEIIRRVRLAPYRKGAGPTFALTVWDTGRYLFGHPGKPLLGYRLRMGRQTLFEGEDFGASPIHATDSDATIASLLGFLTLRPGDTDPDFFADDSEAVNAYRIAHAETLSSYADWRFNADR